MHLLSFSHGNINFFEQRKKRKKVTYLYRIASLLKMKIPIDLVIIALQSTLNKHFFKYIISLDSEKNNRDNELWQGAKYKTP